MNGSSIARAVSLAALLLMLPDLAAGAPEPDRVRVVVEPTALAPLPPELLGFSLEKEQLTSGRLTAANRPLVRLLRLLGRGTLRLGGNTVDRMVIAGAERSLPKSRIDGTYTMAQIEDCLWLARAAGWRVIHGLNLGVEDAGQAASEAARVWARGRDRVLAFEIGNEPDLFKLQKLRPASWNVLQCIEQFAAYRRALERRIAGVPVSGLGAGNIYDSNGWMLPFLALQGPGLAFASAHFYPMVAKTPLPPGTPAVPLLSNMLSRRIADGMSRRFFAPQIAAARRLGLPYRLTEINTVARGGQPGLSDTFASALWVIDWSLRLAAMGVDGIDVQCDLLNANDIYTPLLEMGGVLTARPMYYGMLLLGRLRPGQLVRTRTTGAAADGAKGPEVAVHAVAGAGLQVVLINRDLRRAVRVEVEAPGRAALAGRLLRLAAPRMTSTEGATLGGAVVSTDGMWSPRFERVAPSPGGWPVSLPAASAALLELH